MLVNGFTSIEKYLFIHCAKSNDLHFCWYRKTSKITEPILMKPQQVT